VWLTYIVGVDYAVDIYADFYVCSYADVDGCVSNAAALFIVDVGVGAPVCVRVYVWCVCGCCRWCLLCCSYRSRCR